jgi:hypothetical protein
VSDSDAVRTACTDYNQDLLRRRDFPAACAALTDRSAAAMVAQAQSKGMEAQTREQVFSAVYSMPQAVRLLDATSRTLQISVVDVTGDTAVITYTGKLQGQTSPPLRIEPAGRPAPGASAPRRAPRGRDGGPVPAEASCRG